MERSLLTPRESLFIETIMKDPKLGKEIAHRLKELITAQRKLSAILALEQRIRLAGLLQIEGLTEIKL